MSDVRSGAMLSLPRVRTKQQWWVIYGWGGRRCL